MDDPTILATIGFLVLIVLASVGIYLSQTPCPQCQARGSLRWRHARNDGGPDRRYKDNVRICGRCGWEG